MHRSYVYQSSYYSSTHEYLERTNSIQRVPSLVADYPHFPNLHEIFNNKPVYAEEDDDHQKKISKGNRRRKNHQNHGEHKKVHFVEDEKKMTQAGRDGKRDKVDEKLIDEAADGYIQHKHKGFELCK